MAELSAPLALVKHTAGHLSTTPPIQVLGSERSPALRWSSSLPRGLLSRSLHKNPKSAAPQSSCPRSRGNPPSLMSAREQLGRLSLTAMPTQTSLCGRWCDEKARAPPLPSRCSGTLRRSRRAVDPEKEIALSRTGRTTMPPRRWRTPSSCRTRLAVAVAVASRRTPTRFWPARLARPSGRVIPRPGWRRSAGAIYGPRSSDHQHIESTSAQPDLCPVPRRDDRKWRSSVTHQRADHQHLRDGSVARIDQ